MPNDLQHQYRQLQKKLLLVGWIARGSAYPRHYTIKVNGKSKCCGPYYSLTWKESNKTCTKALSTQQYRLYSKAIANQKKLDLILAQMRKISATFIYQSAPGIITRKRALLTRKSP